MTKLFLMMLAFVSLGHSTGERFAFGGSVDRFRHELAHDANVPNLFFSYHETLYNVVIGGEAATCFFLMGGIKGVLGYRFDTPYLSLTPHLVWGAYRFWTNSAMGPGVGLNLGLTKAPFSLVSSLIRHKTQDSPDYEGYWSTVGIAVRF